MQKTQHWKTIGNCWVFINNKLLIRAVTNQSANRYSVLPKFVVKDQRELSMSNPKFSKSSDILSDGSANNILRPWYLFLDNMRVHNEIILSFFLVWWTVKTNWWRSQFYFYSIVRTSRGTYSVSITYFSFWHDLNLRPMEHNNYTVLLIQYNTWKNEIINYY